MQAAMRYDGLMNEARMKAKVPHVFLVVQEDHEAINFNSPPVPFSLSRPDKQRSDPLNPPSIKAY